MVPSSGHCRAGDMVSGEGVLGVMKENGVSPSAISYGALLCGHAERGEMERIEEVRGGGGEESREIYG